eukprot:12233745-Alexandrium_andersonii.AAC.1
MLVLRDMIGSGANQSLSCTFTSGKPRASWVGHVVASKNARQRDITLVLLHRSAPRNQLKVSSRKCFVLPAVAH